MAEPVDAFNVAAQSTPSATGAAADLPFLEPRDGVPPVVANADDLMRAAKVLASGVGPLAVDAERASSYRYGHRAYLVQLRRAGATTILIDPIACHDLSALGDAVGDTPWVLHAANQDLPCLCELGLRPPALFDTELAGRLAGFPRVGLATMVENLLGYRIAKEHSAADWSRRPLPPSWLRYAALDVELLVELRDELERILYDQGKLTWALQEFEAVRTAPPPAPRAEPWRRTSGIHRVRGPRHLAAVRALWTARDALGRRLDVSPTRLIPDSAIVAAAKAAPASRSALAGLPDFTGRASRRHIDLWWKALAAAAALPDDELPSSTHAARSPDSPPPTHRWADKDAAAAGRLAAAKAAMATLAEANAVPTENLLSPDAVRRLTWSPPEPATPDAVAKALAAYGARPWQVQLAAGPLAKAMIKAATRSVAGA